MATSDFSSASTDHPWVMRLCAGNGRALACVVLVLMAVSYLVNGESFWRSPRDFLFDAYQRWLPRPVPQRQWHATIIDIDNESVAEFGRWPWPRSRLAQLVEATQRLGPAAIGLDIIMPEADTRSPNNLALERHDLDASLRARLTDLPSNDQLLADALSRAPSVVARAALVGATSKPTPVVQQTAMLVRGEPPHQAVQQYAGQLVNMPIIEAAARGRGYVNDTRDRDGVVRTTPLVIDIDGTLAPAFAIELLRVAMGQEQFLIHAKPGGMRGVQMGPFFFPTEPNGRLRVYYAPPLSQPRLSAAAVLHGKVPTGALANQVAIIGATALGIGDIVATPVAQAMDGVEIHGQLIENLLLQTQLIRPARATWWEVLGLLLLGLTLIVLVPKMPPSAALLLFVVVCAALGFTSLLLFRHGRWVIDPSFGVIGGGMVLGCLLTAGHMIANRRLVIERDERMRAAGELRAAQEIQMGMLPNPKHIAGLPPTLDVFALIQPAQEVGGDFYEAVMLDEHRLFFMIGDVSGKGVPAALFMALTKTLAKSMARREASWDRLLSTINAEVSRENPAAFFVTAIAGVIDSNSGVVEWCNAGHNPPLLLRWPDTPRELAAAEGPPLCVVEDFAYSTQRCELAPGDLLFLSTDGVNEAENALHEPYGVKRLTACLSAKPLRNAQQSCTIVHRDIQSFVGEAPSFDDLTILAIGYRTAAAR